MGKSESQRYDDVVKRRDAAEERWEEAHRAWEEARERRQAFEKTGDDYGSDEGYDRYLDELRRLRREEQDAYVLDRLLRAEYDHLANEAEWLKPVFTPEAIILPTPSLSPLERLAKMAPLIAMAATLVLLGMVARSFHTEASPYPSGYEECWDTSTGFRCENDERSWYECWNTDGDQRCEGEGYTEVPWEDPADVSVHDPAGVEPAEPAKPGVAADPAADADPVDDPGPAADPDPVDDPGPVADPGPAADPVADPGPAAEPAESSDWGGVPDLGGVTDWGGGPDLGGAPDSGGVPDLGGGGLPTFPLPGTLF